MEQSSSSIAMQDPSPSSSTRNWNIQPVNLSTVTLEEDFSSFQPMLQDMGCHPSYNDPLQPQPAVFGSAVTQPLPATTADPCAAPFPINYNMVNNNMARYDSVDRYGAQDIRSMGYNHLLLNPSQPDPSLPSPSLGRLPQRTVNNDSCQNTIRRSQMGKMYAHLSASCLFSNTILF